MKAVNATPNGTTVFITDLKLRLSQGSEILVPVRDAARSADLIDAVENNLVRLEFTEVEKNHPGLQRLLMRIEQAEAKRRGVLLFAKIEESIRTGKVTSPDIPVRPAVFVAVSA